MLKIAIYNYVEMPNGVTENQIDHIAIYQRWRSILQDVRNNRGADIASYSIISPHNYCKPTTKTTFNIKKQNKVNKKEI